MTNEPQFVRATIFLDGEGYKLGTIWGLWTTDGEIFVPLHSHSKRALQEIGSLGSIAEQTLTDKEIDALVDATNENTPNKAFVALAVYKLTGEVPNA